MRHLSWACVVVSLMGCATTSAEAVVATYGPVTLRQKEVDARAGDELFKLQEQLFELRVEAAQDLAAEALIAQKAKAANQTEEEWVSLNVDQTPTEPSDASMRSLFENARGRLPGGVSFEEVRPQLLAALQREAKSKRRRELFDKVRREAGFALVIQEPERPRKTVDASGPSRGNPKAKVTIVEFADFECQFCARAHETVQRVLQAYPDQVRLVFRHYPLSFHPKAPAAAEATICAGEQGKFWELHDALFESHELDLDALQMQAKRAGVDEAQYQQCLQSGRPQKALQGDIAEARRAGITGTPAFFINGLMLSGAQPEAAFRKLIDAELQRLGN